MSTQEIESLELWRHAFYIRVAIAGLLGLVAGFVIAVVIMRQGKAEP